MIFTVCKDNFLNYWTHGFIDIPSYLFWQNFCKLLVLPQLNKAYDFGFSVPAVWRFNNSPANVVNTSSKFIGSQNQKSFWLEGTLKIIKSNQLWH